MDCSPPGSSVHGIFEARILEQVAISFSRGSSRPRDQTCVSCIGRQILYHWAAREAQFIHCIGKSSLLYSPVCYIFDSTGISDSICLWLTSLGIIPSTSIHVIADVKTSLFLWLSGILLYAYLCVYTYTHHIFIHSCWWTLRLLLCLAYCK